MQLHFQRGRHDCPFAKETSSMINFSQQANTVGTSVGYTSNIVASNQMHSNVLSSSYSNSSSSSSPPAALISSSASSSAPASHHAGQAVSFSDHQFNEEDDMVRS
jgi:hypothetical protein